MKLTFDSIEEVKEFVISLKGTRGGKKGDDTDEVKGNAPAPIQPPANQTLNTPGFLGSGGFAPPAGGATQAAAGFPAAAAPNSVQEAHPHVARIIAGIEKSLQGGTDVNNMLSWFRNQCGAEAANATLDQIKAVFIPKQSPATLEHIVKLMGV